MIKNMIHTCEKNKIKRLIFVSALGAFKDAKTLFLREKYQAKQLLLASKIPHVVIIRSNVVYDHRALEKDAFLQTVLNLMRKTVYPVARPKSVVSPVFVDDLVDAILACLDCELKFSKNIIEIKGEKKYFLEDFLKMVAKRYIVSNRIAYKGPLSKLLTNYLEHDYSFESVISRLDDYLAISDNDKVMNHLDELTEKVIPDSRPSFEDRISKK